ncbi:MAG: hypothetical protein LBG12_11855 [Synergistaceae bacterium]|jgi:hypothetical protein|nr:hypothetical protein [Synergistaceae bacterium]
MSKDEDRRPDDKEEEQDLLAKVVYLAPLFALILQILEILLKILGVIG